MAQKLVKLYDFVHDHGGATAKMRVAMKTLVPSNKAEQTPDSPELIEKFRAAIREVTGLEAPNV
ncbi:hypothetical protein [Paludibaculum fermentans]|uniref:Uncharacterized protein n=1 Tax=Paludibaculum fermentans TaxID=1473598 RepID=A0A7S7SJB5_PALFE|nr:hypothetical protein [Paludibaculum fermentans]QOY87054.1 hypothetical protein IRI77_30455 [Paludibaculum fermentans]